MSVTEKKCWFFLILVSDCALTIACSRVPIIGPPLRHAPFPISYYLFSWPICSVIQLDKYIWYCQRQPGGRTALLLLNQNRAVHVGQLEASVIREHRGNMLNCNYETVFVQLDFSVTSTHFCPEWLQSWAQQTSKQNT